MRASSWEDLELLYHDHARATGFSVRKSTIRKIDGVIHERYFICSKQGTTKTKIKENERQNAKRKLVPTKRCGCDAHIRIKLDVYSGDIFFKQHVVSYNHTLTRAEWQYLQRSERTTTLKETMKAIEGFEDAHIRSTTAYKYFAKHARGTECVGHTLRDHLNYVNRLRRKEIEGGDVQTVIRQLILCV
ncbi:uncharacterized protein LOC130801105 [Amaranthus tricolor]|uniref:uncharacterized protein LOC130801105 n=1 Tax=Amaranthus tricolor TaxID=29722 RepID=UPI00258ADE6D|nr:uncharacterized protein LOC130801105 [Amaranthus tricolor]